MEPKKNLEKPETLCDTVCAIRETLYECREISNNIGVTLFGIGNTDRTPTESPDSVRSDLCLIHDLAHDLRDSLLSMKKVLGG